MRSTSCKIPLSVFFPCYNEQDNISALLEKTLAFLPNISDDFEVIVVDDGSCDNTAEIVRKFADTDPCVKLISHQENLGYGAALQSGFKAAGKDFVFYTDGDNQFHIEDLARIVPLITDPAIKVDIVSCYRVNRQDSLLRRFNGHLWSSLMGILFGIRLKDVDAAFKLYRREVFDNIKLKSSGALIDTEVLARASRRGYRIVQYPVDHYPRLYGESSGGNIKVVLKAFTELFKLWLDIITDR
ncbi:MAG: glycosyltransferase family 2 protein [Phycisphaerae bacterium]